MTKIKMGRCTFATIVVQNKHIGRPNVNRMSEDALSLIIGTRKKKPNGGKRKMKKFSWFTFKEKDEFERYIENIVHGAGGIAPFRKCHEHYKPCRKGGKRHNHIYNACLRIMFRGKASRRVDRDDKQRFVATFYTSIMLNPQTLGDILKKKWRKNGR